MSPQKKAACKNHPQKMTARRCFYCSEPICSECQQKHAHHLFCSLSCYWKWKANQWLPWFSKYRLAIFLLILIIASDGGLYLLFQQQQERAVENPVVDKQPVDSTWVRPAFSRHKAERQINLEYETNRNGQPFLLWRNGELHSVRIAKRGEVAFAPQLLEPGSNAFKVWTLNKEGQAALVDSFTIHFHLPQFKYLSRQVSRVATKQKILALTFDGGSSNRITEAVLDTLASRNVRCTMFLTGNFLRHYGPQVVRIVRDGHEVGNHSLNHPHLTTLEENGRQNTRPDVDNIFIREQLSATDSLFRVLTGQRMSPFWRAPYGEVNPEILRWAAAAGYKHINWTQKGDSWDWVADTSSALYRSAPEMLNHFLNLETKQGLEGFILLWHLGSERRKDFPYTILGQLIDTLRARGYRFVTMSDLLLAEAKSDPAS